MSKKRNKHARAAAKAPLRTKGWAVVRTQAVREKTAAANIKALGFDVYLPAAIKYITDRSSRHRRHIKQSVMAPVFPQYLMVLVDALKDPWQHINKAVGVHGMLCSGDQPAFLPDGLVEALQGYDFETKGLPKPELKEGTDVNVTDGPFAGFVAKVVRVDARDRITVLLHVLGRQTNTQLQAGQFVIR